MSLIELFFTDSVNIRPYLRQGAGEPIYGDLETRRCRLERGVKLNNSAKSSHGDIKVAPAGARMYCVGDPIPTGSIVEGKDRDYIVVNCRILNGFYDHHLEVTLQ